MGLWDQDGLSSSEKRSSSSDGYRTSVRPSQVMQNKLLRRSFGTSGSG
jgi:hypothetical protein